MKRRVFLAQVNNTFGKGAFLPYSVGLLQAYAQAQPEIREHYEFSGFAFLREDIHNLLNRMDSPDVVGISCYIWNFNYSMALAKAVHERYPGCLVVLGGPHVPNRSEWFFEDHPYADLLVHFEGEHTFTDILRERLNTNPDYTWIPGLSVREGVTCIKTAKRDRITDLDGIPSPYLTGVFDSLLDGKYDYHPTDEVDRGCPYSCHFCDWGSAVFQKVRRFDTARKFAELEWYGRNQMGLLYNASANFGMTDKDIEFTEQMIRTKQKYGYPEKFRAAYAKNSNERVFTIAKMLNDAGMNKGITLSFQSMDDNTLTLIRRKNIKVTDFENLMIRYRKEGIATYSEIIIGLPGETYDTFADGLDKLVVAGQHDSLNVYTAELLPNAEMSDPAYRQAHGTRSTTVPVLFFHGTPSSDPHQERYELVTATAAMPEEDWVRAQRLSWAFQCFHCLGLTQMIALYLNRCHQTSYRTLYEALLAHADSQPDSLLGREVRRITGQFRGMQRGEAWGIVDQRFGDIIWPLEEGSCLNFLASPALFYLEIQEWLKRQFPDIRRELLSDLVSYQCYSLKSPYLQRVQLVSRFDFKFFFEQAYYGPADLPERQCTFVWEQPENYQSDLTRFAREVIWFGRKGGSNFRKVEEIG